MPVAWSERYATGEDKIDRQHETLFGCINQLEEMVAQDEISDAKVKELLQFLENYTRIHFAYEEMCMFRLKCPVHEVNIDAHDKFTKAIEDFTARFAREGASKRLLQEMYDAASKWLVNHICKIDQKLQAV